MRKKSNFNFTRDGCYGKAETFLAMCPAYYTFTYGYARGSTHKKEDIFKFMKESYPPALLRYFAYSGTI